MKRSLLVALPLSIAVHAAAGTAALLLFERDSSPPPLFIDLTEVAPDTAPPPAPATRRTVRATPRIGPPEPAPRGEPAPRVEPPRAEPERRVEPEPERPPQPAVAERLPEVPPSPSPPAPSPPVTAAPSSPAPIVGGAPATPAPRAGGEPRAAPIVPPGGAGGGTTIAGDERGSSAGRRGGSGTGGSSDGVDGAVATAAPGSSSGVEDGAYLGYLNQIRRRLRDVLEYPPAARRRNLAGTVHVDVVIRADGSVGDVIVAKSSSYAVLDDAAVDAIRRLPPTPFPTGLPPRPLRARLPVVFELR